MASFLYVSLRKFFSVKALSQKCLIFYRVFTTIPVNYESCDSLLLTVYIFMIKTNIKERPRIRTGPSQEAKCNEQRRKIYNLTQTFHVNHK